MARSSPVKFDEPGFDDEAAEFDEVPRALAALDLPRAHVMSRPCGLMTVARRPVALEGRPVLRSVVGAVRRDRL